MPFFQIYCLFSLQIISFQGQIKKPETAIDLISALMIKMINIELSMVLSMELFVDVKYFFEHNI